MEKENTNINELQEIVVQCYRRVFDKDIAYRKAGCTKEQIDLFEKDVMFQERMEYFLIEEKERIIHNFRSFMDSEDEKISYKATEQLGRILYPEFFKELTPKPNNGVNVNLYNMDKLEEERIIAEYGRVLEDTSSLMEEQPFTVEDEQAN